MYVCIYTYIYIYIYYNYIYIYIYIYTYNDVREERRALAKTPVTLPRRR